MTARPEPWYGPELGRCVVPPAGDPGRGLTQLARDRPRASRAADGTSRSACRMAALLAQGGCVEPRPRCRHHGSRVEAWRADRQRIRHPRSPARAAQLDGADITNRFSPAKAWTTERTRAQSIAGGPRIDPMSRPATSPRASPAPVYEFDSRNERNEMFRSRRAARRCPGAAARAAGHGLAGVTVVRSGPGAHGGSCVSCLGAAPTTTAGPDKPAPDGYQIATIGKARVRWPE
jgi:hypothetical protein